MISWWGGNILRQSLRRCLTVFRKSICSNLNPPAAGPHVNELLLYLNAGLSFNMLICSLLELLEGHPSREELEWLNFSYYGKLWIGTKTQRLFFRTNFVSWSWDAIWSSLSRRLISYSYSIQSRLHDDFEMIQRQGLESGSCKSIVLNSEDTKRNSL